MKKNVGIIDQAIRFLIAFTAVLLYFADCISGLLAVSLFVLLALTAMVNFCPLYTLLKISTKKDKSEL
ncbi:MAG TPA: DUF2892 domain-containing protein [Flavobacterium sp.]|jgi:hypothetical protein|nr:DUF2892 domain-containing protein [Flavobacterium sp.]HPJ09859.1 DUF2892 domain-containing protein [Flavobacterium sp.]